MAAGMALDGEQVHGRVSSYVDEEVTDALYTFGTLLIAANRERTKTLEGKAMTVAGYGLAILAFLVSKEPSQSVLGPWPPGWISVASVLAGLALCCAGAALLIQKHPWFSDSQWFEAEDGVLQNHDSLKRCHVLAMHSINRHMNSSNDFKANFVLGSQILVLGAGLCLAAWIALR
jgi:hypothetical protein